MKCGEKKFNTKKQGSQTVSYPKIPKIFLHLSMSLDRRKHQQWDLYFYFLFLFIFLWQAIFHITKITSTITGNLGSLYKDANGCATVGAELLPLFPGWSLKRVGLCWKIYIGITNSSKRFPFLQCVWPSYAFRLLNEGERNNFRVLEGLQWHWTISVLV